MFMAFPPVSLSFDIRTFDNRPPLLGLALMKGRERLRRELVAQRNIEADIGDTLTYRGIGERLDDGRVKPRDDILRRALRRPEAGPHRDLDTRHTRFVGGRDVRRRLPALL